MRRAALVLLLLVTALTGEARGYSKLLQDAPTTGQKAREVLDGIRKDFEMNVDFQLRWLGLRWNDTGGLCLCKSSCLSQKMRIISRLIGLTLYNAHISPAGGDVLFPSASLMGNWVDRLVSYKFAHSGFD